MKVRTYQQSARAASVALTRTRILDATDRLFLGPSGPQFSLDQVAADAGTTVQTVLRHFRSKDELLAAGAERALAQLQEERDAVPAGDLAAVAAYLERHYEEQGTAVFRMVSLEAQSPAVAAIVERGRQLHRRWVERVLAPLLDGLPRAERRRRAALLVVATDLLTWRLLRVEQGLSRREYRASVLDLLHRLAPAAVPGSPGGDPT